MGALPGFYAKLCIDDSTIDTSSLPLDFLSESLACNEIFLDRSGLRGTRSHQIENTRVGTRDISGQIRLQPNMQEWAYLFPWILGTAAAGTTYALSETLLTRNVAVCRDDGTDGKTFTYSNCKIDKARIFASGQERLLTCELDVVGIDETVGNAGTFPALTLDTATGPLTFSDSTGAVSIGGSAYDVADFEIIIENHLDRERYFNSNTRTALIAQDRTISVNITPGYGDAEALYNVGIGGSAVTITLTQATTSLLFSFVKVQFPRQSPTVPGRQEIMLPLRGKALMSSSTRELVVTLDSTV